MMPRPQAPRTGRHGSVDRSLARPRARVEADNGGSVTEAPKLELEQIHQTIQSAGLHRTAPRVAVLQLLMSADSPLSHAELAEQLKAGGVGSATIYANLKALSSVGLVRRLDLGDHVWRYELAQTAKRGRPNRDRLHFLCSKCGRVSRMPGTSVSIKLSPQSPKSVTEGSFETFVRGVCDDCHSEDVG
jgi:Fur family ferric uptake transcriptional regulator